MGEVKYTAWVCSQKKRGKMNTISLMIYVTPCRSCWARNWSKGGSFSRNAICQIPVQEGDAAVEDVGLVLHKLLECYRV